MLRLVQDHAAELLRFAARFSHCADDGHDAYQRSLEILVRRMRTDPPAEPLRWLRTVLRHEALAIRAQRDRHVSRFEPELDLRESRHLEDPVERALGQERLAHAAEALRRLKPQELTALVLRAEGLTYKQICERTGWTWTRCNRSVYEGRRALAQRLRAIESGAECERWAPLLSALADGEATAAALAELRPHLRACPGCRATLRGYHAAPAQVAALVPVALLPAASEPVGSLLEHAGVALHALAERATLVAARVQGGLEGASGAKVAAVAASTAALAGGGAAIERASGDGPGGGRTPAVAAAPDAASHLGDLAGFVQRAGAVLPSAPRSSGARQRRTVARREFAPPEPTRPSEFAPQAEPAEFASATPPAASASTAPASPTASQPPSPSEFSGP